MTIAGASDSSRRTRQQASLAISRAIKKGTITREPCEICGMNPISTSKGKQLVRAYHYLGYSKNYHLNVKWYCVKHYPERDQKGKTQKSPNSRKYPSKDEIDRKAILITDGPFQDKNCKKLIFQSFVFVIDANDRIIQKGPGTLQSRRN